MRISCNFESGSIEVVDSSNPKDVKLKIRNDSNSEFLQWFYFRVQGEKNQEYTLNIVNAGESTYPSGWNNYRAFATYDRENWFRVPTSFDGKTLTINHKSEHNTVYYSYFVPYSYERHLNLISKAQLSPLCEMIDLGQTVDGRDMNLLIVGNEEENKKKIWVIARQHPGETMAEWFMEGFLNSLLNNDEPAIKSLLNKAVFYVVPNMNPDGSYRGNLRSNAAGANLNREWLEPSKERSPEVYYVREQMHKKGVDLSLDIHGDEDIPYNFVATCVGNPSYDERIKGLEKAFIDHLMLISPDFQNEHGYEDGKHSAEQLKIGSNYIGETFKCLSLTLEMPFKDNDNLPNEKTGWSPDRSKILARDVLNTLNIVIEKV